ncbi:hypothetical protein ACXIHB_10400 [Tenacibaculum sp. IMCC1]|uniref:GIY-YIG domain-containing protein n=1 Tax=Tenacibaculum sp. Pbs-1 TaxID=3238748 RepID=A0AB33KZP6_9FLAO
MEVDWIKCENNNWCNFSTVNLNHEHFNDLKGVYIIWSGETVVRLGSGSIKDRIADHRNNSEIIAYSNLKVTWAKINGNQMQGVEKYLSDILTPKIGERFPDRIPINVNFPWS